MQKREKEDPLVSQSDRSEGGLEKLDLHGSPRVYTAREQCFERRHGGRDLEGASKRYWTAQQKKTSNHQVKSFRIL